MLHETSYIIIAIRANNQFGTARQQTEEKWMIRILTVFVFVAALAGCESLYDDDGIPRIHSQRDADAYNATVSSDSQKLVCEREQVTGSNLRQFVCMTVAQREGLRQRSREDAEFLSRTLINRGGGSTPQ